MNSVCLCNLLIRVKFTKFLAEFEFYALKTLIDGQ